MSGISRRKLILGGLGAAAGLAGLGVDARLAVKYGLVPPDHGGVYGPGETLNYGFQRLVARRSLAVEWPRSKISKRPFPNELAPLSDAYKRLQAGGFADWRLTVDGMVERPAAFPLDQLRSYPQSKQITEVACEEGWSYVAEWTGVRLSHVLNMVGVQPQAKYLVYFSIDPNWWDSIDMDEAMHPQTFLTCGMNGNDLPVGNGGPLRMRLPRQLGYKSVKFITRLALTDDIKKFGDGRGSPEPRFGYAWYAGV
jgi:DMSO/TMAO reductase YedYZ molybdopterin-dependent catalytic subunit